MVGKAREPSQHEVACCARCRRAATSARWPSPRTPRRSRTAASPAQTRGCRGSGTRCRMGVFQRRTQRWFSHAVAWRSGAQFLDGKHSVSQGWEASERRTDQGIAACTRRGAARCATRLHPCHSTSGLSGSVDLDISGACKVHIERGDAVTGANGLTCRQSLQGTNIAASAGGRTR